MRRSDDPQIDLQRGNPPWFTHRLTGGHEVYAKAAHNAALSEDPADPQRKLLNPPTIATSGGEAAANVRLVGRSTEDLVVSGNEQHFPVGTCAQLGAW